MSQYFKVHPVNPQLRLLNRAAEIIRQGETGRNFPAGDAGALAQAVRATLAEAETTRAMCERGRAMVEQHHSLDAMLDQLDAIYRRYLPG